MARAVEQPERLQPAHEAWDSGGSSMTTAVVVGNPKPASRTLDAAVMVAERVTGQAQDVVIDVVTLGTGLLGWVDEAVADAVAAVQCASAVVVASPTYKASYTGLLKLFL